MTCICPGNFWGEHCEKEHQKIGTYTKNLNFFIDTICTVLSAQYYIPYYYGFFICRFFPSLSWSMCCLCYSVSDSDNSSHCTYLLLLEVDEKDQGPM